MCESYCNNEKRHKECNQVLCHRQHTIYEYREIYKEALYTEMSHYQIG